MKNKLFWDIVERDRQIVESWPKWMQQIMITAETCSTGKFIIINLTRLDEGK